MNDETIASRLILVEVQEGDDFIKFMKENGGFISWIDENNITFSPINLTLEKISHLDELHIHAEDEIIVSVLFEQDEQYIYFKDQMKGEILSSLSLEEKGDPIAILVSVDELRTGDCLLIPTINCHNVSFPINYREHQPVIVSFKKDKFFARGGDGGMNW